MTGRTIADSGTGRDPLAEVDLAEVVAALGQLLHAAGVPVTPDRSGRLASALALARPATVDELYWAGRVTLVSDADQIAAYDAVFGQVFRGVADDSSVVEALEAGLEAYEGKALLNSVTGEEERLERVLPLVRKHGCAVVAISNDDTGISEDIDVRFEVAKKIVQRAMDYGIPAADVVVDPLVMPVGAINTAGRQVLELVKRLRTEQKVNTTCGASNLSFGLPNRNGLNAAFIGMAIGAGMTSAITNPLHADLMQAIRGADVVMGHDPECSRWIHACREGGAANGEARGRRGGRRRRAGPG